MCITMTAYHDTQHCPNSGSKCVRQVVRHVELLSCMLILRLLRIRGPNCAKVHRWVHQLPVAASGHARQCILLSAFVIVSRLPLVRCHCSTSRNTTLTHRIGGSADLSRELLQVSSLFSFMPHVYVLL